MGNSKTKVQIVVWGCIIGIVYLLGVYYFMREFEDLSCCKALYCSIRLFVFEGELDPFPQSWQLRVLYFIAPVIAVSAVVNIAVTFLFRISPFLRTCCMSNHVVVCGIGRIGGLLAETLKKKGAAVVGVDLGPPEAYEDWIIQNRIPMIFGDFHQESILLKSRAYRARSIIFSSGDDLTNLEGAVNAYEFLQKRKGDCRLIWAHIANERLAATAKGAIHQNGIVDIRFFDTYHIAAYKMIHKYFNADIRKGLTEINILGFGKFGRDLLEGMILELKNVNSFTIKVIDKKDRSKDVHDLAESYNVSGAVSFLQVDIQHLDLNHQDHNAFFLCTDDDLGNLAAAMILAEKGTVKHVYVRMTRWPIPAIGDHLGRDRGVVFININDLVTQGIEELEGFLK